MVFENFEGLGGGGAQRPKFLRESMKLNWNFQRGCGGGRGLFWNLTMYGARKTRQIDLQYVSYM